MSNKIFSEIDFKKITIFGVIGLICLFCFISICIAPSYMDELARLAASHIYISLPLLLLLLRGEIEKLRVGKIWLVAQYLS